MRPSATKLRGVVLVAGLMLGVLGSAFAPACIIPDYCIVFETYGNNWCVFVEYAEMWPIGQPELAEQVVGEDFRLPRACKCLNDGEELIIGQGVPAEQAAALAEEIEQAARLACATTVPPGYDHNCFIEAEGLGPTFTIPFYDGSSDECVGSCAYINDPPFGSCGDDPNPWECNGQGLGETGSSDSSTGGPDGTDTGSDDTPFGGPERIGQ